MRPLTLARDAGGIKADAPCRLCIPATLVHRSMVTTDDLKGCTAPNPSLALGQTTPVLLATEEDGAGNPALAKNLLGAIKRIERMPAELPREDTDF
ncbi:hypothetical protein ACFL09_00440 [Planctomycetota bacterium]